MISPSESEIDISTGQRLTGRVEKLNGDGGDMGWHDVFVWQGGR